ncbi:MAG TPA: ATP-binding protein, partial [Candidatus Obscuribacterales bacterium]
RTLGDRIWQFVKIPLQEAQAISQLDNGEICLVLATDVTEQQQVAKELVTKNADLVQLNRLKDEFLACISHELKTPLTAVLGLSSLLKDQLLGELNERQARYSKLIHQSGRQLMTVVNDIFDLTHMETGQIELTLTSVKIPDVCASAYLNAQQIQPARDERLGESPPETPFSLEIEPGLEMLVADELRLRQMLVHLLANALKFTDPAGKIGLKVSRLEGWIAFTVWDTGIGIPPEKQHLIFQKFQQLENPLTRQFPGTGLGLVLTQRLARLHGGDISFISKTGQGSQFTLLLPPSPPPSSAAIDATHPDGQPRCAYVNSKRLVLIVEAVPDYIEDLTEQLTSLGYRVIIARSGTEAIEKARRFQPGVVLLNPLLPQLSGWDVLTILKSDAETRHIPVLVTGSSAEKETAKQNQADGFLSLPVEVSALRQNLNDLTKQKVCDRISLTILRLTPEQEEIEQPTVDSPANLWSTAIGLKPHSALSYRVLEADDLEQAELLSRVWHPDVVLLDSVELSDPLTYLQQLSQQTSLAATPLVTVDRQTTEAANQVSGLSVFPCLEATQSNYTGALLQVIQVAAGMCWQPTILVVDIATLSDLDGTSKIYPSSNISHASHEWLQALIQYLQTAGFRSVLSHSWAEVSDQLQHQNVDLMLIHLGDMQPDDELVKALTSQTLPPVLMLDHRSGDVADRPYSNDLEAVCTHAVSVNSQSMAELLDLIDRAIANR